MKFWMTIGPSVAHIFPGSDLFYGKTTMPGGAASVNVEYKNIVYTFDTYAIDNLGNGFMTGDNASTLSAYSLLVGWRVYADKGSVILSAGLSKGGMRITTGDAGYTNGGWLFSQEVYNHFESDFIGVPVQIRYLTKGKHVGAELGLYCNFHRYTDMGLSASFSFGKRK